MSEDLRAYFAAEVPLPDWAERAAVIDYLTGYERRLESAEYFDEARVRALVARIVDRTRNMAASMMNHALAEEGELARRPPDAAAAVLDVRHRGDAARSLKPQFSIFSASCTPAFTPLAGLSRTTPIKVRLPLAASNSRQWLATSV